MRRETQRVGALQRSEAGGAVVRDVKGDGVDLCALAGERERAAVRAARQRARDDDGNRRAAEATGNCAAEYQSWAALGRESSRRLSGGLGRDRPGEIRAA